MASNYDFFTFLGAKTIDLTAGATVKTAPIPVYGIQGFSIEPINAVGLNGVPTWSLLASNITPVLPNYDSNFATNLPIDEGLVTNDLVHMNYFVIEIANNGNTTGTVQFIINKGVLNG